MECPFRYSHHTVPSRFNFCPYCASKVVTVYDKKGLQTKTVKAHQNNEWQEQKKRLPSGFPELYSLLERI